MVPLHYYYVVLQYGLPTSTRRNANWTGGSHSTHGTSTSKSWCWCDESITSSLLLLFRVNYVAIKKATWLTTQPGVSKGYGDYPYSCFKFWRDEQMNTIKKNKTTSVTTGGASQRDKRHQQGRLLLATTTSHFVIFHICFSFLFLTSLTWSRVSSRL